MENKKIIPYDRTKPFNNLPDLPPLEDKILDIDLLKKLAKTRGALGKLDGIVRTLANPQMLVNTITLREAKDSSEIENIFTTHDELYQSLAIETTSMSRGAREVLRYREALEKGFEAMDGNRKLDLTTIRAIYQCIENTNQGIRPPTLNTVIKKGGSSLTSGKTIYTPPRGAGIIESKLDNFLDYCNNDKKYDHDPLIKLAIAHYQFEVIHPFADGNGRTGRILNILLLHQKGLLKHPVLYLSGFIMKHKNDYYEKLGAVTQRYSWKPWILFILEGIEQTCHYTINLIERINELQKSINDHVLAKNPRYNQEIIKLLFYQPYIRAIHIVNSPSCGIKSRQNATIKLNELVDMNMITKKTVGRETVYINFQLMEVLGE